MLAEHSLEGTDRFSRTTLDCGVLFSSLLKTIELPHAESDEQQRYEYTDYDRDDPPWLFQNVLVESCAHTLRLRWRFY
jgi:hypothetical protein